MKNKNSHILQIISFFVILSVFIILAVFLALPFLKLLFLAVILTILFLPMQNWLAKKFNNESLAALAIIAAILIVIVVPLYFIVQSTIANAVDFYGQYKEGNIRIDSQLLINRLPERWQERALYLIGDVSRIAGEWVNSFSLDFQALLSNIAAFLFSFLLFFLSLFYLLKDHHEIKSYLEKIFPFSTSDESLFIDKTTKAVNGVIKGDFIIALMQGTAAASGFILAGLPQPLFFGFVTVISSFIPTVGTSLVIIPAIIYLLLFKSLLSALLLAIWYILIHLTIDNVVAPKLIGSRTHIHPLIILFSVVGGIKLFGVFGFLFGPIAMTILVSLVDVYLINQQQAK
ncbi:MAG: AI-2E family transporter [Candidatus Komeilibacteria bacterium]|nr:AI-2E family transporter [Candidatus Komeilibacteria bacterium]